jgi:putative transposase
MDHALCPNFLSPNTASANHVVRPPVQENDHLLAVLRYVERNPVRAGLAAQAQDWLWSSAAPARLGSPTRDDGPLPRPPDWLGYVNAAQTEAEAAALRECTRRRRPYGDAGWVERVAGQLGLESSLRPRGRPRKPKDEAPALFPTDGLQ